MGKWKYGVVLDAGSSGTRIYIYRWLKSAVANAVATEDELHELPALKTKKKWTMKVHPGIASFAESPEDVGPGHLAILFKQALDVVPKDEVQNTPIFLLATAGMRLLPENQRNTLLREICSYAQQTTGFQLPECDLHIQVIPGETEGLYGWVAANYLVGGFHRSQEHAHGKDHHTYGFLDMGGASAQIAFAPNATEAEKHANDLQLLRLRAVDGVQSEYRVFVTTWLGYGANEARRRYVEALMDSVDLRETLLIPDPCLPNGLQIKTDGTVINSGSGEAEGTEPYLVGTGRFPECLAQTFPLLDKQALCEDPPCLFHGVHVPAIDFSINHFIGISEFWHTTHEIFEMAHTDKAYDFLTYQKRVTEFCSQDWTSVSQGVNDQQWGKKVDTERAVEACFKASWLINMLHEGIGIPRVGIEASSQAQGSNGTKEILDAVRPEDYLAPFQAVNKIDDTEVSWTLGKMVLYAASQVPPANEGTLAVGFGSNVPGIPKDFQFAGGNPDPLTPGSIDMSNYDDLDDYNDDIDDAGQTDWQTRLLSTSNLPRRTPGYLLFFVILVVAAFLLCGRDRRTNLVRKLTGVFRRNNPGNASAGLRKRTGFATKLPFGLGGSGKGRYERMLDDDEAQMPHPADFELGVVSSSSDDDAASLSSKGSGSVGSGRRHHSRTGTATPRKMVPASPYIANGGGYFEGTTASSSASSVAQGVGLGLGPLPMSQISFDRGVIPRNESRERLDRIATGFGFDGAGAAFGNATGGGGGGGVGIGTGHRSRAASPSRWRSPLLTPLKESLD